MLVSLCDISLFPDRALIAMAPLCCCISSCVTSQRHAFLEGLLGVLRLRLTTLYSQGSKFVEALGEDGKYG